MTQGVKIDLVQWNPQYLAYCRSNGHEVEAQQALDKEQWPGGHMCGFQLFVMGHWAEWKRINNIRGWDILGDVHHDMFDKWLNRRYP